MAKQHLKGLQYRKPRKKVEDTATSYYRTRKFSTNIQGIKVSKFKLQEQYRKYGKYYLERIYLPRIYKQLGMHYFESKDDFYKWHLDYKSRGIEYTKDAVDRMWEMYKHRNELVITGQFQDYVADLYKENYKKYLIGLGMTEQEVQNIDSLTRSQWLSMAFEPVGDKSREDRTELPPIESFNYGDGEVLERTRDKLREIFKEHGLAWSETGEEYYIRRYSRIFYHTKLTEDDISYENLLATASTRLVSYKDKEGNFQAYIPFVGSTRGKNREFILDVLHYIEENE